MLNVPEEKKSVYTKEQLERYPYFAEQLKKSDITALLDPLTGLISRGYILWFAQWLIEHEITFSYGMSKMLCQPVAISPLSLK